MLSLLLFQQIATLFILILLGWIIVKAGILRSEDSRVLSMILLYIITPCVIISSFQLQRTPETTRMMLFSLGCAVVLNALNLLLGRLFSSLLRLDVVETASVMYPNATNLTIPLVSAVFGQEWIMYVTIFSMLMTSLSWIHCRVLISGERNVPIRQVVCNINIISIILGLLLFIFQISLPEIVQDAFTMAGSTVGPVAMLIVGMLMADIDIASLRKYRRIWKPVTLRLVVLPLILVTLCKYSGAAALVPHGETLMLISLFSAIAPSANVVTQFSQMYGRDARYAGLINAVTMLLCIVTMPLLVAYFQM